MLYNGLIVEDTGIPPNDETIKLLEEELGAQLPPDYKDFLMQCNGGHVAYGFNIHLEDGSKHFINIPYFCKLDQGDDSDGNPRLLRQLRSEGMLTNESILPIAHAGNGPNGSMLFLDLRKDGRCVMVLEDFEFIDAAEEPFMEIAKDFSSYWKLLCLSDEFVQELIDNTSPDDDIEYLIRWLDTGAPTWREKYCKKFDRRFGKQS